MAYAEDQAVVIEDGGEAIALTPEQLEALEEEQKRQDEQRAEKLNALGQALAKKRTIAINGRSNCGIEQLWMEDEDAYDGIDDVNRAEEARNNTRYRRGQGTSGGLTEVKRDDSHSRVLLNITQPYCDAVSARVSDMLMPIDDKPWAFDTTPIPELTELVQAGESENPEFAKTNPALQAEIEQAKMVMAKAKKSAEKAEKRVDDWLVECQWHSETRAVIEDLVRAGTGVLKGPFPVKRKQQVYANGALNINEEIKPASKRVDYWNVYPDPACGEDVQNGAYVWERDEVTAKTLRDLKGQDGVIDSELDAVLEEGPKSIDPTIKDVQRTTVTDETPFSLWYFHGCIERDDLEAAGCDCGEDDVYIPAVLTMVNDRVVRASLNPLDSGSFPYDFICWRRRIGMPWGCGVSRELRTPQTMITGAVRNMSENAGLSAGPQLILLKGALIPANGKYEMTPRKVWFADPNKGVAQAQHAFMAVNIDARQQELMAIIEFALRMAEQVTGVPALMQGQMGNAPDKVGIVTILNNNASSVLRRVARLFDSKIIEPHITRYYEWLLLYGPKDDEKGLFIIDARGSSVLAERDLQSQIIMQMAPLTQNPAYRIDPAKYFAELAKSQRIDPSRLQYSEEEWKEISSQPPPKDPRVEVAEINAQVKGALVQNDNQQADQDRRFELIKLAMEAEVKQAEQEGARVISTDRLKAILAQTAVQEKNKRDLYMDEKRLKLATGQGI